MDNLIENLTRANNDIARQIYELQCLVKDLIKNNEMAMRMLNEVLGCEKCGDCKKECDNCDTCGTSPETGQ